MEIVRVNINWMFGYEINSSMPLRNDYYLQPKFNQQIKTILFFLFAKDILSFLIQSNASPNSKHKLMGISTTKQHPLKLTYETKSN